MSEQEAIERLREAAQLASGKFVQSADLRALLDSHDSLCTIAAQLAEALRETRDMNPHRCPACGMGGRRVHYVGCSLDAALEAWEAYQKIDGGGYDNGKG